MGCPIGDVYDDCMWSIIHQKYNFLEIITIYYVQLKFNYYKIDLSESTLILSLSGFAFLKKVFHDFDLLPRALPSVSVW